MSIDPSSLEFFPDLDKVVQSIGPPLAPDDLDSYLRLKEFHIKSYQLRTAIDVWKEQQNQDRATRKYYAKWLLILICIQMGIINLLFILIGLGKLTVQQWTANTFIMSVFAEIAAMVVIVVNYLFPKVKESTTSLLDILKGRGS